MASQEEKSLYERLGGYDGVFAAVDDFLDRVTSDPQIGVYWKGHSNDSMERDRQLIVDFLCEASGGPARYRGRDMKTSHEGLGINDPDWKIFMDHAAAMLDHFEVPQREKTEVLEFFESLKGEIVE